MAQLDIEQELAERLREIAQRENRRVEEILASLLDLYTAQSDLLSAMDGMFDDDVEDLSTTVRETMDAYYKKECTFYRRGFSIFRPLHSDYLELLP